MNVSPVLRYEVGAADYHVQTRDDHCKVLGITDQLINATTPDSVNTLKTSVGISSCEGTASGGRSKRSATKDIYMTLNSRGRARTIPCSNA